MSLEVRVSGTVRLHQLAARMRAEGRKDLLREMGDALTQAAEPLKDRIRIEASEVMPAEGGYKEEFNKSLKFRVQRRGASAASDVTLTTYATGTSERRDIRALNKGVLRHPVYGRSRAGKRKGERHTNPWAVTSIRDKFWDRGTKNAADEAEKRMLKVVEQFSEKLLGEG
jgi:hypothetical protein